MTLSIAGSAVNGLVEILSLLRFRIAAVIHAHQPGAVAASADLADFSGHRDTYRAARHTGGTLRRAIRSNCWDLWK
jgi:hypothetical protein